MKKMSYRHFTHFNINSDKLQYNWRQELNLFKSEYMRLYVKPVQKKIADTYCLTSRRSGLSLSLLNHTSSSFSVPSKKTCELAPAMPVKIWKITLNSTVTSTSSTGLYPYGRHFSGMNAHQISYLRKLMTYQPYK